MSVKSLFRKNKQAVTVGKYLKSSAPNTLGNGIESDAHLKASLTRSLYFLPDIDYSDPENFVKFGSAKEYYKNAFSYIANYYPYDGSFLEKTKFYNDLAPIEKYVLEEIYPRSTGYITNGANYGVITTDPSGYYSSSIEQFVRIKGGPHSGSIYNESQGRTSNLEFGGVSGSSVEFFFKKNSVIDKDRSSERQVILDVWNGAPLADSDYGRMRIEIASGSSGEDKFLVTLRSGSNGFVTASVPSAGNISISDGTWRNFGFVFNTSGSTPTIDFYTNGECIETVTTGSGVISSVTGTMIATLGALQTDVETVAGVGQGYGKLSASLDEFRFWKSARNAQEIGRWWFDDVGGGSNKYSANVDLGVYLRFNEGITQTASVDRVLLDYSGRLSNGHYLGYDETYSRNTGSAINDLSIKNIEEIASPIIRTSNSLYQTTYTTYVNTGSYYDGLNSARLLNHLPAWIIEEEEDGANEILSLTQIIASYFDTIYNQITALKNIKHMNYNSGSLSASMNEFPFNDRLVESMGIETPEIFANIGTLQQFLKRDEQIVFDQNLKDIKNSIYKNIYNNINFILKSKGNEKSIRNFIRCLGVGEEIISLNTYSNNSDFKLASSYKTDSSEKKYVDFSALQDVDAASATVYQYYDSTNSNSVGVISGSTDLQDFVFSLQSEVVFPNKQNYQLLSHRLPTVISSSLFGFHTPLDSTASSVDLTWASAPNDYGLQVYAVKSPGEYPAVYEPAGRVMDAFFLVKDRAGTTLLTSSIFNNVYDNQRWNFTLSLRPKKWPFNDGVLGASVATDGYTLQLHGVNCDNGVAKTEFSTEEGIAYATGQSIIESSKRIYAGAHRTNYTGSLLTYADSKISSVRYWTDYLPTGSLVNQALEADSYGRTNPSRNAYSFQTNAPNAYIPQIQTLALDWDFTNITGSNASGQFSVVDFSSGSIAGEYDSDYQGTMLSSINLRQHTGRGDFFKASSTPVRKEYVYTNKLQGPEYISSEDMIRVLSSDDEAFGVNIRPENFYFAVERSLYRSISNRMLHLFASIDEFNNLIGEPVNKFRLNYKRMEKMREIFFRKVNNNTIDIDKYVKYYKWLDDAMSEMIQQLLPGSARYAPNVRNVVESHVLERPKIQYGFPLLKDRSNFGEGILGPAGNAGGAPVDLGLEGDPHDAVVYPPVVPPAPRDTPGGIRPIDPPPIPNRVIPSPIPRSPGGAGLGGGINPRVPNYSWRYNHAPVNNLQSHNATWWQLSAERYSNVLSGPGTLIYSRQSIQKALQREVDSKRTVSFGMSFSGDYSSGANQAKNKKYKITGVTFDSFEEQPDIVDSPVPDEKKRVSFRATIGGQSFNGEQMTPFTALSTTITAGYNAYLASVGLPNVDLTNMHQDVVQPEGGSSPLQGPFTRRYVGGTEARHNAAFRTADRTEEYNLSISAGVGTISSVSPTSAPKGQYLRGLAAKRPVNLKNIQTSVTNHSVTSGVRQIGNFERNYEVVLGNNRADTNIDFVFNTDQYDVSMPSAFITTPSMRSNNATGSADYAAPRQRPARRTTQTIIVNTFAAPGSKLDSKQQFRDVNSNQYSPNNALPFRNIPVRTSLNTRLSAHTLFGGYESGDPTTPSVHKAPSNQTRRLQISTTSPLAYITGTFYDNAFVTRPIPAGDSTQWFMALSGSNTGLYSDYILSGNRYPNDIPVPVTSFDSDPSFGKAIYTSSAGKYEFIWGHDPEIAPWTQLREGSTNQGSYFRRNNIFELPPTRRYKITIPSPPSEVTYGGGTTSRQTTDRAGNTLGYYYSQRFKETPLTSRYKPLRHVVRTPLGTPSRTGQTLTTLGMKYSYGNSLMGFANRELNREIQGRLKFSHGQIKRPYEIMRDQRVSNLPEYVNGLNLIKIFEYSETIYPKEIYTYLSGTRARFSFVNDFWKDNSTLPGGSPAALASYVSLRTPSTKNYYNRQMPRQTGDYVTSQGYTILAKEQTPYNTLDPSYPEAIGNGSASMWPLDTYLYADYNSSLVGVLTASIPVLMADAATMACGELMMTHYGSINDNITNSSYANGSASYQTASVNSAQYVYNIPATQLVTLSETPATASASITASLYQGQPLEAATAEITVGSMADRASLHGGAEIVTTQGSSATVYFEFDKSTGGFVYDPAMKTYTVGLVGSAGATTEDIRDSLYDALSDSVSSVPVDYSVNKDPSDTAKIQLTASTAGSAMNSKTISSIVGLSSGIGVVSWANGADADFDGKTLILEDASVTHTMTFDSSVTIAASSPSIIGVQDATSSANDVAGAIASSITDAQASGLIFISVNGSPTVGIVDLSADNAGTAMNTKPITGSAVADEGYLSVVAFAGGKNANVSNYYLPEPRSPGAAYTRPSWTAGQSRRYVDGAAKGTSADASYPFYNTYEDYAQDIRLAAKDHTIIPEFRISEHVSQYQQLGPLAATISSSLSITGANGDNYSGLNTSFYERFALTDTPEFLGDLMPMSEDNRNFIFNNHPRHFELSSNAVAKLLPYNGFYPVDRTLDIAKSFYESYNSQAVYEGDDAATTQAWRSIYKPFFAPGILYNSIKSGLAVDYPIRRATRNDGAFLSSSATTPLKGALSGTLAAVAAGQVPGNQRRQTNELDWSDADVNKFFWGDRLPFESIMDPASFLEQGFDQPVVLSDINEYLHHDVSGSISAKGLDDTLYKKMVSNFLANVPKFFLKKKFNKFGHEGHLTKFVSQFGSLPKSSQQVTNPERTVVVDNKSAYMMEVGLLKTDNFNLYSNPYAFGIPTATGSEGWSGLTPNQTPSGSTWPVHRGEFAPFTPPYYYGPSLVRLLFVPSSRREEYTLEQIINNEEGELFIQYLNESGSYFDVASGSYVDRDGNDVATTATPDYGWNRAWQNRMDIDATINVHNQFPIGVGGTYISSDPNKWTIMPKWETPILDFPNRYGGGTSYDFSSSVTPSEYTSSAQGMWHQYGVTPDHNKGIYLYIKDIPTGKDEEYDRVALGQLDGTGGNTAVNYEYVKKIPKFVIDSQRQVRSLADLCGFDPDEIIRKGFDPNKAKRMGELPEDNEKKLSEAIVALPVYRDEKQNIRLVTLNAPANELGPKIKEFRKKFTKYSFPPALAKQLQDLVPSGYPHIPEVINPFGDDDYDEILQGGKISTIPVVYLMEHVINLSRQDLADIWQGVLPDIGRNFKLSFSAIDHYMPGNLVEDGTTKFPEVLKKQLELSVERTGHPRYDLLDVATPNSKNGLFPEIKWLVFKVKERGLTDYSHMVMEEVDGNAALGYDNVRGYLARSGMSEEQLTALDQMKDTFAKNSYLLKHSVNNPTYNWPYDYFSLLELAKIDTKVGFRPDLEKEYAEEENSSNNLLPININIPPGSTLPMASNQPVTLSLLATPNNNEET